MVSRASIDRKAAQIRARRERERKAKEKKADYIGRGKSAGKKMGKTISKAAKKAGSALATAAKNYKADYNDPKKAKERKARAKRFESFFNQKWV